MVVVGRSVYVSGVQSISRHGRHKVCRVVHGHVQPCTAVAREIRYSKSTNQQTDVFIDDFDFKVIAFRSGGRIHSNLLDLRE